MFAAVIDLQEAHPIISLNPNEMTRSDLAQTLTSTFCHTSHAVSPLSQGMAIITLFSAVYHHSLTGASNTNLKEQSVDFFGWLLHSSPFVFPFGQ